MRVLVSQFPIDLPNPFKNLLGLALELGKKLVLYHLKKYFLQ